MIDNQQLITDLIQVIEAVHNNDKADAIKLLYDIIEDLKINSLLGQ